MCRRGRRAAGSSSRSATPPFERSGDTCACGAEFPETGCCAAKNVQLSLILTRIGTARHAPPTSPGEVVLFNKPYGVLCQFSGDGTRPTLADWVPVPGVYPAGRLDADSEGLVVLTADGALQARISHPRHRLPKTYFTEVEGMASDAALASLARGVDLGGFVTAPATVRRVPAPAWLWPRDPPVRFRKSVPTSWLELAITEGKHRQVRRMTAAVGLPTLRLIRWSVGCWSLADLPSGAWLALPVTAAELQPSRALAGAPNERAMIRRRFRPALPPR